MLPTDGRHLFWQVVVTVTVNGVNSNSLHWYGAACLTLLLHALDGYSIITFIKVLLQVKSVKEIKRNNKVRIAKYISRRGITSKAEISSMLGLSMPTTLQNVKELVETGVVEESGVYESTGGRKAKALSISPEVGFAAGMDITANHITFVLVNMKREPVNKKRTRIPYENTFSYYEKMGELLHDFIKESGVREEKIIGVGISLPGIVNKEEKVLLRSHALNVKNVSFKTIENVIGFPYALENDANSAAYAELTESVKNTVYLSLSSTVGGAIYLHDKLYPGENFRSGEFGHMIIEKGGRPCYCGKRGCADAYCSAKVLQRLADDNLELFFRKLKDGEENCVQVWEQYLDDLAVVVSNLRMAFDCDVVLGGYVGGYLEEFLPELGRKIMEYNKFDLDTSYLRTGKYKLEAAAYGVTLRFVEHFFDTL